MKGSTDIPQLHHTVLLAMVQAVPVPPSLVFTNMFRDEQVASDEVMWESELTSSGITPFVSPGAPAPLIGMEGFTHHSAKVAYWKEKMYFDESFLNNLRQPGTLLAQNSERVLANGMQKLTFRSMRRKEWMCCKAMLDGKLSYSDEHGVIFNVDYGRPAMNTAALSDEKKWGTGTNRNPVEDVYDIVELMSDFYGVTIDTLIMTRKTMGLLVHDAKIQDLLKKSSFGEGNLFATPAPVLASLLGVGRVQIVDDAAELTIGLYSVNGTTLTVENAYNIEVGDMVYLDRSGSRYLVERQAVTAVDVASNTITIASAFASATPLRDRLVVKKKYVPDNVVLFTPSSIGGSTVGRFLQAPHGIPAQFGRVGDSSPVQFDPEGIYIRVRDKGLPILENPGAMYKLTVA